MQSIIKNLPQNENDTEFVFSAESFKNIPNQDIILDQFVIKTATHNYHNSIDELNLDFSNIMWVIHFSAEKVIYELMAIELMRLLFVKNERFIKIQLANKNSTIKNLIIVLQQDENPFYKEIKKPISYEYYVESLKKFPLSEQENNDLSKFHLAFSNPAVNRSGDYTNADTCVIELNNTSLINLAKLWLNMSRKGNVLNELCLESPIFGFGGVSKYSSCEAVFWLPASIGFEY